jgi:hypothetical protein
MMTTPRRAGTRCPRWLVLASAILVATGSSARAQDVTIRQEDRNRLDEYRGGAKPPGDPASKEIFDKFARYFVAKLNDSEWQKGTDQSKNMSELVRQLDRALQILPLTSFTWPQHYAKLSANQKQYVDEFGKVLIAALERPALSASKPIVRINATRMAAEVARSGYDGAAELLLKILDKPEETDGYRESARFYALQGLHFMFEIVPDPNAPEKTVFQKKNAVQLPPLEQQSIKAIIDYIMRKPITDPNIPVEAQQYIRREAIRALGHVRVQSVKAGPANAVVARPALVLLRIAQGDGISPPPTAYERARAVIGFCQLVPDRDRDMQIDYAAYHVAQALAEIAQPYVRDSKDQSLPWKDIAQLLRDGLDTWGKNAATNLLPNNQLIPNLRNTADANVLQALEAGAAGIAPNLPVLQGWADSNKPASTSLFKSDQSTTVTPGRQGQ